MAWVWRALAAARPGHRRADVNRRSNAPLGGDPVGCADAVGNGDPMACDDAKD